MYKTCSMRWTVEKCVLIFEPLTKKKKTFGHRWVHAVNVGFKTHFNTNKWGGKVCN